MTLSGRISSLKRQGARIETAARRCPLVVLTCFAGTGIVLADAGNRAAAIVVLLAGVVLTIALMRQRRPALPLLCGGLSAFLLFGWMHSERLEAIHAFPFAAEMAKGNSIEISGKGWIADRVAVGDRSVSGTLQIESIQLRGVAVATNHRVPVRIQQRRTDLKYGQPLRFSGLLHPLEQAAAPGGFDPAAFYFRESGSLARLEIREGDELTLLPGWSGSKIVRFAQGLRDHLEAGLFAGVPPEHAPYAKLIAAMSLGARENTPEELEESFRRSGTMHLFAVSGLHVGVVAGLLLGGLLLCRVPRRTAVLIVIPLVLFYAVLTGLRPSALRAGLMLAVVLAGFSVKEKPNLLNSLGLAALLILGFDTQQLFLPGFQLSFAVLLFIALFAAPLQDRVAAPWLSDPFLPKSLRGRMRRAKDQFVTGLAMAFAVSLVSWLGSLGLLVWHFQSFAPIGVLANVLMVPLASVVVSIAAISLAFFCVQGVWLSSLLNQVNVGLTILLTSLAQFFGAIPGAYQNSGGFSGLPHRPPGAVTLDLMGVGGGSAILLDFPAVESSPRSRWMIDPGGSETYRRQMLPLLRSRAVNRIDALLLTHGDSDHIGEAAIVLSQFRPHLLLESALPNRSPVYPEIDRIAETLPLQRLRLEAGQRLLPAPGVSLRVLAPDSARPGRLADDRALVLKLSYGEMEILLTSDAGFETEKQLLEQGVDLGADLWIRGQHIESPSGLPAFIEAVSPQLVLSSSSDFPAAETIPASLRKTLAENGIPLLEIERTGVITIHLQTGQISVHPFTGTERPLIIPRKEISKKTTASPVSMTIPPGEARATK